jgi:chromosome segregation ATPase
MESLQSERAELNTIWEELDTTKTDVEAQVHKLPEEQRVLAAERDALDGQRKAVESARTKLDARMKQLKAALRAFQTDRSEVDRRQRELNQQAEQIELERAKLKEEQAELRQLRNELHLERDLLTSRSQSEFTNHSRPVVRNSADQEVADSGDSETTNPDVQALRSTLASMFDIQKPLPVSSATPTGRHQPDSDELSDADDPDSVSAYMERLLTRSRRGEPRPDFTRSWKAAPPKHKQELAGTMAGTSALPPTNLIVEEQERPAKKTESRSAEPKRVRPNKEELRADIKSLRELANFSAQSDVARHGWKKLRGRLFVKVALTLTWFGVCGALILGIEGVSHRNPSFAGIAAAIGTYMVFEFYKSIQHQMTLKP